MANEKRLIDATPLIDECRECMNIEWNASVYATWAEAEEDFMNRLLDAPTVDAVEVKHGRWIEVRGRYVCSVCKSRALLHFGGIGQHLSPYCPNCGAKMDGDGNG